VSEPGAVVVTGGGGVDALEAGAILGDEAGESNTSAADNTMHG
jgi:hypothetical protein